MTRSRYGLAIILQSFGIYRKMKRMTDAANELHLMQEGEEILGTLCWRNVEQVEDLSMEYWNIRKIEGDRVEIDEQIAEAEETLVAAHKERALLVDKNKDSGQELFNQREDLFQEMEDLNTSRETIMEEAMQVKRRFEALKVKAIVLRDEGQSDDPAYSATLEEIQKLRAHFDELKADQAKIDSKVEDKQEELQSFQLIIDEKNKDDKSNASEVYALISRANRDITTHKAQLGLLADEYARLCQQVGRHLNIHGKEPVIVTACQGHQGLLEQIRLLRRSIHWNKRLITRAGG